MKDYRNSNLVIKTWTRCKSVVCRHLYFRSFTVSTPRFKHREVMHLLINIDEETTNYYSAVVR